MVDEDDVSLQALARHAAGGCAARLVVRRLCGVAVPVAASFDAPTDVVAAQDASGRLFVAEPGGRIWAVSAGARRATPFVNLGAFTAAAGERGLLGVAFHRDFRANGRMFV